MQTECLLCFDLFLCVKCLKYLPKFPSKRVDGNNFLLRIYFLLCPWLPLTWQQLQTALARSGLKLEMISYSSFVTDASFCRIFCRHVCFLLRSSHLTEGNILICSQIHMKSILNVTNMNDSSQNSPGNFTIQSICYYNLLIVISQFHFFWCMYHLYLKFCPWHREEIKCYPQHEAKTTLD